MRPLRRITPATTITMRGSAAKNAAINKAINGSVISEMCGGMYRWAISMAISTDAATAPAAVHQRRSRRNTHTAAPYQKSFAMRIRIASSRRSKMNASNGRQLNGAGVDAK